MKDILTEQKDTLSLQDRHLPCGAERHLPCGAERHRHENPGTIALNVRLSSMLDTFLGLIPSEQEVAFPDRETKLTLSLESKLSPAQQVRAIYTRTEYNADDSLYLILPLHEVAIPYHQGEEHLLETLALTLVKRGDITSSQSLSDYPIVTSTQLTLWFPTYEKVPLLKTIPVYKPRPALSGWELRRREETRRERANLRKLLAEREADRLDPFKGGEGKLSAPDYSLASGSKQKATKQESLFD